MQKYLEKANVLIEALPYIRKFNSKIILKNTADQLWKMKS